MAAEQTIRVSAKGEFGQLQRGLKQLQQDLKGVAGVVDRGAGKGGFFDEKQTRALELYKRRFMGTMGEINAEFRKQNDVIEALHSKMSTAQRAEREEIRQTIAQREKQLDVLRKELMTTERLYSKRSKEAGSFRSPSPPAQNEPTTVSRGGLGSGGMLSGLIGAGKFALGLAGLTGVASLASKAYDLSYERATGSLDLAQRLRGQSGWSGKATDMWDRSADVGRKDRMGYTAAESWGFMEQYSRIAGAINTSQQQDLLKFGRGYGLNSSEVAGVVGANQAIGGTQTPKGFADAIAGSVAKTGMTPRILEVMETNNALLSQMNTTLKDGSSKQILAYQTTLDKIGVEKGMTQLTGAQGGNMIAGLGGIFQPGNDKWKWMGIQALRNYSPQKYGKMDLFDMEMSYEDGLMNADNIPAMAKYIRSQTGGNKKLDKYIMQRWLTDGGYAATKREASEFYDATDGLTKFSPDQIESLKNGAIDSGTKYDAERKSDAGQGYMDVDSRFQHALEQAGQPLLTIVQGLEEDVTSLLESLNDGTGLAGGTLEKILDFMTRNLGGLATSENIMKVVTAIGILSAANKLGGAIGAGKSAASGVGGMLATGSKLVGASAATAAIFGLLDGVTNKDEHIKAAKEAGLDPESLGLVDRTVAGAVYGAEKVTGYITGEKADRKDGYELLEKVDPADPDSLWADNARTTAKKNADLYRRMTPEDRKAQDHINAVSAANTRKGAKQTEAVQKATSGLQAEYDKTFDTIFKAGADIYDWLYASWNGGKPSPHQRAEDAKAAAKDRAEEKEVDSPFIPSAMRLKSFAPKMFPGLFVSSPDGGDSDIGQLPARLGGLPIDNQPEDLSKLPAQMDRLKNDGTKALSDFRKDGIVKLLDLSEDGNTRFKRMDKSTSDMTADAQAKYASMEQNSGDLLDKATWIFRTMYYKVANTMDYMLEEHRNMVAELSGTSKYTDGVGGDFSSGLGQGYKITQNSGVSVQDLNKQLKGLLAGYGSEYIKAGNKYGIDPAFLVAVSMQETGGTSLALKNKNNVGGMMGKNGLLSFKSIPDGIDAMASNIAENYVPQGIDTVEKVQKKYAPIGAANDPDNLNNDWSKGVNGILSDLLGNSHKGIDTGYSFFKGWESRVTSRFGDKEGFRSKPHGGLDINGEQGDALDALSSGKVSFIKMDDGGPNDPDGKANTTPGGSTVGIKMSDGNTYYYAHMSAVNSKLKVGDNIAAGEWLGNMGGDKGAAGSGSSTTGSHLHLGYMNKDGVLMDPVSLLNSLNAGDSDIGKMNPEQFVTSSRTPFGSSSSPSQQVVTTKSEITVKLDLTGEGAKSLNNATLSQLEKLVNRIVTERERQLLRMSPTKAGYS
ncbi:peptidoglycan DD-metalloendopeptidase family protein [Paenibacillus durus]|uniref:peptidoglycan DD-metalloendopeptidase family protein n=3 Tax=Paenibacillus durus TaxID=44251 RepID=UPI00069C4656|nr:peptidoglycan DD-metalloendopeptidase family protein [Paenibacillus durus]